MLFSPVPFAYSCCVCFADAQEAKSDLTSIGVQIMEQFFREKNSTLSENCLRQLKKKVGVEFVVENVFRKKLINKHEKLNKKLYNVNEAFVKNPNEITQEVQLETFFVTEAMEKYRINISSVDGLMGEFQFPSVRNRDIFLVFFGSKRLLHAIDKPFRLVTRQFKIKMDPLTMRRVNFNYYTFKNVWNYEVQFEISNTSTIQFPYNVEESCPSERSPRLSLNVCNFLDKYPNFVESLNYTSDDQQIKLDHINGNYILKGFPVIEELSSAEVVTVLSEKDEL